MRPVVIALDTWYLTSDKTKVVKEGDPEGRVLLVAKGGEIDKTVAEAYAIPTGEGVEVSRVTESAYEQYKNGVGFGTGDTETPYNKAEVTRQIAAKINAESPLSQGSGVTATQKAFLTEGLVNQEIAKQSAKDAPTVDDSAQDKETGEDGIKDTGSGVADTLRQASTKPRNKRTKTIGAYPDEIDPDTDTGNGELKTPEMKSE